MTIQPHCGPFQPYLFCDSVTAVARGAGTLFGCWDTVGRALRGEGATALETELPCQSKCDVSCSRAKLLSACLSPALGRTAARVKEGLCLPDFFSPGPLE